MGGKLSSTKVVRRAPSVLKRQDHRPLNRIRIHYKLKPGKSNKPTKEKEPDPSKPAKPAKPPQNIQVEILKNETLTKIIDEIHPSKNKK